MNKLSTTIKISALALVLSFGLSYALAWTAPTATPPGANVAAPINASATSQTKSGDLTLGRLFTTASSSIGTTAQTQTLTVAGTIGATEDICTAAGGGVCLSTATGGGAIDPAPIGSIVSYAGATAPSGYLICNGAAVSRTTYAALFAAIGTTYGVGNGSTTFNIPDLRGEFVRGFDAGRGVDSGRVLGSWQVDLFKSHTHTINNVIMLGGGYLPYSNIAGPQTGTTNPTGGSETRPRNVAMNYIIKAVNNSEMVLVTGGPVTSLTAGTGVTLSPVGPNATGDITITSTRTRLTAGTGITLSPAGPNVTGDVTITATAVSSTGSVTGGCAFGAGWGTATNCGLGAGMTCSAGNTARILAYAATNGVMQWSSAGTYAHGYCIKN